MAESPSVLLVDDEADILEFLEYNLKKDGFVVHKAIDGITAIDLAIRHKPDLIVLDVMMPGLDGIETCKALRELEPLKHTKIIFLTARGEDYSQIAGFSAGSDDYIVKPISPQVFVKRIKAILSRSRIFATPCDKSINISNLCIDRERYVVIKDQCEYTLPRKEFELLFLLASRPNKVFSRQEILDLIWKDGSCIGERTIDVHIRKIRGKLKITNIFTITGVGYKFDSK